MGDFYKEITVKKPEIKKNPFNYLCTFFWIQDYFGKRGISVHVDVFLMKMDSAYHKAVYLTVSDQSKQDQAETLGVAKMVLQKFKHDYEKIEKLISKSDNAGCYHSAATIDVLRQLARENQMELTRYDFSEPQLGKDCCDREAAYFKERIRRFADKNPMNKINNAEALVQAVMEDGGPKNTNITIVNFETNKPVINNKQTIKNISTYHSFELEEEHIRCYEYYGIGKGVTEKYSKVNLEYDVGDQTWISSSRQNVQMSQNTHNDTIYHCETGVCKCSFQSEQELMEHVAIGNHSYITVKTLGDKARELIVKKKHVHFMEEQKAVASSVDATGVLNKKQIKNFEKIYKSNWALPIRKTSRFTASQKNFVRREFEKGETLSEGKLTDERIAQAMQDYKVNGESYFESWECLDPSQVKGVIAGFKKQKKSARVDVAECNNDYDSLDTADEIHALFEEISKEEEIDLSKNVSQPKQKKIKIDDEQPSTSTVKRADPQPSSSKETKTYSKPSTIRSKISNPKYYSDYSYSPPQKKKDNQPGPFLKAFDQVFNSSSNTNSFSTKQFSQPSKKYTDYQKYQSPVAAESKSNSTTSSTEPRDFIHKEKEDKETDTKTKKETNKEKNKETKNETKIQEQDNELQRYPSEMFPRVPSDESFMYPEIPQHDPNERRRHRLRRRER